MSDQHVATRSAEERALFLRFAQDRDPARRAQIIERYLPLARQLARRYHRPGESSEDLLQVASVGLVKAVDRFDPSHGTAFSSFAVPTILGEIKRYFRDRTWSVRVPRDLQELALKLDRLVEDLSRELRRPPSIDELAERAGATVEQVLEAREAAGAYRAGSLDAPRGSGDEPGETVGEALGCAEDGFVLAENRATLARLLSTISDREREILRLRFEEDLTQAEIGELIGVSQMQVSRLLRRSITRLRAAAQAD